MPESTTPDFLDAPEPAPDAPAARPRRGPAGWMSTGAWLVAGLVLGALVVAMLHTNKSASATGLPAGSPAANQAPNGQVPTGQPGSGFRGGLPGEQHVVGTLTAVGASSITVTGNGRSATYPIESSTLLVKDGQRVSSPSALSVGDTVVVHVYPQNGSTHTEMVIDGVPAGRGDDNGPGDNTAGTTTET
jgi:hypothetical protein